MSNKQKQLVEYWQKTAEHDYVTMISLYKAKRFSDCLFFGHIILEKIMSKFKVKKIVKKYVNALKDNGLSVESTYLFGSYVSNKANEWSDIDVAIVINDNKMNFWKNLSFFSRISLSVDKRLETHVFSVDDFKNDSDPMVFEIKKTGVRVP